MTEGAPRCQPKHAALRDQHSEGLFPFWPPSKPPRTHQTPLDTPAAPTSFQHRLTWFLGSFPMCFLTISPAFSNSLFLIQTTTACRGKQGQIEAGHRSSSLPASTHNSPITAGTSLGDNEGTPHVRLLPPSPTRGKSCTTCLLRKKKILQLPSSFSAQPPSSCLQQRTPRG